jgi:hypothetical protein
MGQGGVKGDRHHDAATSLRAEVSSHVLGKGLGGAPEEVEEKLAALAEDPAPEARHGEDEMTMRDGREDLVPARSGDRNTRCFPGTCQSIQRQSPRERRIRPTLIARAAGESFIGSR